jgi:hypothetical protein
LLHTAFTAVVETEYHRSQKLRHDVLSKRIISEVLIWKTSEKGEALINKYYEQGYISDDDLIELLNEHTLTTHQLGAAGQRIVMGFPG